MFIKNRNSIINVHNIDTLSIKRERINNKYMFVISAYNGSVNDKAKIKAYSTEEKAIKVLDIICEQYQYNEMYKCGIKGERPPQFIFQMPRDDEV